MDSDDGATASKNRSTRVRAPAIKEEYNSRNNVDNHDDDADDDDEVQILMPQRGRDLPVKSAPYKVATSAANTSSYFSAQSETKPAQTISHANSSRAGATRKNNSDDEVENDDEDGDDVDDRWSGRHQSREVRGCSRCIQYDGRRVVDRPVLNRNR